MVWSFWQGHKDLFAFSAKQKIEVRLGQALGGNARPHCNGSVQVLPSLNQKKKHPFGVHFLLVRATGLEPARKSIGT